VHEVGKKPEGQRRARSRPLSDPRSPAPPAAAPRTQEHRGQPRQPRGPPLQHPAAPLPAPRCRRQPRLCSARGASSPPPPPAPPRGCTLHRRLSGLLRAASAGCVCAGSGARAAASWAVRVLRLCPRNGRVCEELENGCESSLGTGESSSSPAASQARREDGRATRRCG